MAFREELTAAAEWLIANRNSDGGWGVVPGQASALVCTAEAAFVLRKAGKVVEHEGAIKFLRSNWRDHLAHRGSRTRYVAFTLFALADAGHSLSDKDVSECISWLESCQMANGAWSSQSEGGGDYLFSTFLACWALLASDYEGSALSRSQQWLLAIGSDTGWALRSELGPTPVATAYAVLALAGNAAAEHRLRVARSQLTQTKLWTQHEEAIVAGTAWKHCTYAFVVPALLELGERTYSPVVAEAIRQINRSRSHKGGWSEGSAGRTVRAQFWAVHALASVWEAFDPDRDIPAIDAERAEATLEEPDFVKFKVRTPWAIVMPARVYWWLTYTVGLLILLLVSGLHLNLTIPAGADRVVVLGALLIGYQLVRARPNLFPRLSRALRLALIAVALFNVVFGLTLITMLDTLKVIVDNVWAVIR